MTYTNRNLTTPDFINTDSPFWKCISNNIAENLGENCCHKNFMDKYVICIPKYGKLQCQITCKKCSMIFHETGKITTYMMDYYGF